MKRKEEKIMPLRRDQTSADLFASIAGDVSRLIELYDRRLEGIERRLEELEKKARALRNRAPIRELNSRLQDAEIRLYQIERASRGYPKPPVSGSAADN